MDNEYSWEQPMFIFDNPYGYQVNINHPLIQPLYYRFKNWKDIPRSFPLSDEERFEFENYIKDKFLRNFKKAVNTYV